MGPLESWDLQSLQNTQCQPSQYCFFKSIYYFFLRISHRHALYFDHAHPCNLLPKSFHIHGTPPLPISCLLLINNILNPVCAAPIGWSMANLSGTTLLKKTDSPSLSTVNCWKHPLSPCCYVGWLVLTQVLCSRSQQLCICGCSCLVVSKGCSFALVLPDFRRS